MLLKEAAPVGVAQYGTGGETEPKSGAFTVHF